MPVAIYENYHASSCRYPKLAQSIYTFLLEYDELPKKNNEDKLNRCTF